MRRASFTVVSKRGIRYDANHLTIARENHPIESAQRSVLTFLCSGMIVTLPADEIESVSFHPAGATYCSECDQSIFNVVGAGVHGNPELVNG